MARNPKFIKALENMRETHDTKNEDYAEEGNPYSNFEEAGETAGITTDQQFLSLIGVKLARLRQLFSGKTPNYESLEDTLKDLAVYATILYSYHLPDSEPCSTISDRTGFPCLMDVGHEPANRLWKHRSKVGLF